MTNELSVKSTIQQLVKPAMQWASKLVIWQVWSQQVDEPAVQHLSCLKLTIQWSVKHTIWQVSRASELANCQSSKLVHPTSCLAMWESGFPCLFCTVCVLQMSWQTDNLIIQKISAQCHLQCCHSHCHCWNCIVNPASWWASSFSNWACLKSASHWFLKLTNQQGAKVVSQWARNFAI